MKEFFNSTKFKILVAIVAVLFGMMLYSASVDGAKNIPQNLLSMVVSPFQKLSAVLTDATSEFFAVFYNAQENADENDRLKAEIDDLQQKLVDFEILKDENSQLKKIAGIKETYADFSITPAFVIGRDPSDRYGSFTIDKGSLHDIALHDPVMADGSLIGFISEVSPINSRVQTILNPKTYVSAFDIATKELGVVEGELMLAEKGECKLSILSEKTDIEVGSMIVTAGSSGKYPKGIPIGTVLQTSPESHGATMHGIIEPLVEIDKIITVEVITEFLGQGSELLQYDK